MCVHRLRREGEAPGHRNMNQRCEDSHDLDGPTVFLVMNSYQLHIKVERAWVWICTIDAPTHAEAFRHVLICLRPDEHAHPIRLEQDTENAYRKPCPPDRIRP